jgi:hypothetical protein
MRQGELLGLRWRDVDWTAQRTVCGHALDAAQQIVWNRAQQRVDLLGVEEANVGVGRGEQRLLDQLCPRRVRDAEVASRVRGSLQRDRG